MRMRLGFVIGLGTGYVLGTRAGRERYEQIRGSIERLMDTEQARELKMRATQAVEQVKEQVQQKARERFGSEERTIRLEGSEQMPAPVQEPFTTAGLSEAP